MTSSQNPVANTEVLERLANARKALRAAENLLYEATCITTNSGVRGDLLRAIGGCHDAVKRSREWLDMQTLDHLTEWTTIVGAHDDAE